MSRTNKVIVMLLLAMLMSGCVKAGRSPQPNMATQELIDRGVAFMEHDEWDLAEASFRVAVESEMVPQAYDGLACVALARGNIAEARGLFHNILDWFPDYEPVYWHLAYLEESEGNIMIANNWHKKAVEVNAVGYKEKTNYALFLQDRFKNDRTDNFSKDLAITYLNDVVALTGTSPQKLKRSIKNKDTFRDE